jgi:succinate dehydrogenase/fumarate reductase flavoprotein subunit
MTAGGDHVHLSSRVLIVGAGAAGMSAAIAAHDRGADTLLVDRSLIGRGGATVMAQMTVAAAVGDEVDDDWQSHLADTLAAGRGLCNQRLARMVCEDGPKAIRQMEEWHVGWAKRPDGKLRQTQAPGHDRPRCVYVDFLNTGPAVSRTLRAQVQRRPAIRRIGDLCITDLIVAGGAVHGAVGFSLADSRTVSIAASAVVLTTGGLTRLYQRNSGSANMGGDGYALALRAGAELIDMEFVQFFPIGHLAPRLIGMDPIMWDPFRYKLGGRLLNGKLKEFIDDYGIAEDNRYVAPRDVATYAILKEVEAGRGSPSGGVYLSFQHIEAEKLREAFGPVIDRLAANGIDLARMAVEVAPIAHYHMGGIRVDGELKTCVDGLFAAGEAIGGANGANRLSGNAITEALVFGRRAGLAAAERNARNASHSVADDAANAARWMSGGVDRHDANSAAVIARLQSVMSARAGPFRTETGLNQALSEIDDLRESLGANPPACSGPFDTHRLDWFDARNMLLVAESVARSALERRESRGAHQREDHPDVNPEWLSHQVVRLESGRLRFERVGLGSEGAEAAQ